tara:strand:+ start:230 stop:520 length:291 start_codon:yes stop_codon:yes gene_type:complete
MKLADALLRRKELQEKVNQLRALKESDMCEFLFERKSVNDSMDDIKARIPKVDAAKLTKEYDSYASKLRKIDAGIQQLNWTVDINIEDSIWVNYSE